MRLEDAMTERPWWKQHWKWNVTEPVGPRDDLLIFRRCLFQTPLFGLFLHTHYRGDADRHLHDHPWTFVTWILRGGYSETRAQTPVVGVLTRQRTWGRWSVHRIHAFKEAHKIDTIEPGTVTLMLVGRHRRSWGFWVNHADDPAMSELHYWVPHQLYLGLDPGAPGEIP